MGMNDFGVTFNPASSMDQSQRGGSPDPNASVQQAIRTLSLRLPSVVGAKSIAPMSLLAGGGSQNMPGGQGQPFGLQQILQILMGGGDPMAGKPATGGVVNPNFKFVNPGEPAPGTYTPIGEEADPTYRKPTPQPIPNAGPLPPIGWGADPVYRKNDGLTNKFDAGSRFSE